MRDDEFTNPAQLRAKYQKRRARKPNAEQEFVLPGTVQSVTQSDVLDPSNSIINPLEIPNNQGLGGTSKRPDIELLPI